MPEVTWDKVARITTEESEGFGLDEWGTSPWGSPDAGVWYKADRVETTWVKES